MRLSDPLQKWLWQCEIPQACHRQDESLRKARDEICVPERACCSNLCIVKAKDEWVRFTSLFVCSLFLSLSLWFPPTNASSCFFFRLAFGRWTVFFLLLPSSFLEQFGSSFKWSGRDVGRGILITYINICIHAGWPSESSVTSSLSPSSHPDTLIYLLCSAIQKDLEQPGDISIATQLHSADGYAALFYALFSGGQIKPAMEAAVESKEGSQWGAARTARVSSVSFFFLFLAV